MHNAKRLAVFGLFFFSGSCALVYQITWMRLFRLVMGNTVFTSATVLTAFMAGLAIGSFVALKMANTRNGRFFGRGRGKPPTGKQGFFVVGAGRCHRLGGPRPGPSHSRREQNVGLGQLPPVGQGV